MEKVKQQRDDAIMEMSRLSVIGFVRDREKNFLSLLGFSAPQWEEVTILHSLLMLAVVADDSGMLPKMQAAQAQIDVVLKLPSCWGERKDKTPRTIANEILKGVRSELEETITALYHTQQMDDAAEIIADAVSAARSQCVIMAHRVMQTISPPEDTDSEMIANLKREILSK